MKDFFVDKNVVYWVYVGLVLSFDLFSKIWVDCTLRILWNEKKSIIGKEFGTSSQNAGVGSLFLVNFHSFGYVFSCERCDLYYQYVSVCGMWPGATPPHHEHSGSRSECIMHFDWLKGFDGSHLAIFGPGKQYMYRLCAGSQGGNISFGLLRVAILVFLCGGSHYTWGLPFCFAAPQLYYWNQFIWI